MIDAEALYELLKNATPTVEEVFDTRFEEIVSLVDEERLTEASKLIVSVLKEGKIDLRLVMYLLYAQFVNQGVGSLKTICPLIRALLEEHWEKISPVKMRDKYLPTSLSWFFSSIGKKIKRSEKLYKSKKVDDFWNLSVQSLTPQMIDPFIVDMKEFASYFYKKTEEPSVNQYVLFIVKWLENLKTIVEVENEAPVEEESSEVTAAPLPAPPATEVSLSDIFATSEPMLLLHRKLKAFATFIEQQKFEKAALVAEDISLVMKQFDPSLFFPKLFTKYFALAATHIDTLAQEWENKNPLKWEAMQKLYHTDLNGFLEW